MKTIEATARVILTYTIVLDIDVEVEVADDAPDTVIRQAIDAELDSTVDDLTVENENGEYSPSEFEVEELTYDGQPEDAEDGGV